MGLILCLIGMFFIHIALRARNRRHKVYRYSMLACIFTCIIIVGYDIVSGSNIIFICLDTMLIAIASGAFFISERTNREKISDVGEHL